MRDADSACFTPSLLIDAAAMTFMRYSHAHHYAADANTSYGSGVEWASCLPRRRYRNRRSAFATKTSPQNAAADDAYSHAVRVERHDARLMP